MYWGEIKAKNWSFQLLCALRRLFVALSVFIMNAERLLYFGMLKFVTYHLQDVAINQFVVGCS